MKLRCHTLTGGVNAEGRILPPTWKRQDKQAVELFSAQLKKVIIEWNLPGFRIVHGMLKQNEKFRLIQYLIHHNKATVRLALRTDNFAICDWPLEDENSLEDFDSPALHTPTGLQQLRDVVEKLLEKITAPA